MARENDVHFLGGTQLIIGASTAVQFLASNQGVWRAVKLFSGNSCSIVNGSTFAWQTGWPLTSTEFTMVPGPATMYIAAGSATCVVACLNGLGSGATFG